MRNGHLPAKLEEIGTPQMDPFDDKPLRYRAKGRGFLLYCIDRDGVEIPFEVL